MNKKRDDTQSWDGLSGFQVLEHQNSDALNALLKDPNVMQSFANTLDHNKFDILYPTDNEGLLIMESHNRFIEYLKDRANQNR